MQQTPQPRMTEPLLLLAAIVLAALGAIIGIQLITTLGISANTSILGALIAICVSRIPIAALAGFRDIRRQNLVQTAVSAATFGAANCLMTAIGIPWLMGMPELVWPMLIGASLAMLVDATMLYRMFDSKVFPATGVWRREWQRPRRCGPAIVVAKKRSSWVLVLPLGLVVRHWVSRCPLPVSL